MAEQDGIVVFVCSMCGKILCMNKSTWISAAQQKSQPIPLSREPIPEILTPFDDIEQWSHYSDFQSFISLTKDENIPSFPLCDICAEAANEHTIRMNEMMTQFIDNTDTIERYGSEFRKLVLKNTLVLSPFSTKRRGNSKQQQMRRIQSSVQGPGFDQKISTLKSDQDNMANQQVPRKITPRFTQLSAFSLSIDGMFAKINGLRLGKLKSISVPISEIQNALYFLCQFLRYQMTLVGIDPINVRVTSNIVFVTAKGNYELKFPEKTRDQNGFNEALTVMMGTFDQVFNSKALARMRPSNLIDANKNIIAGETYFYSESDPSKFTRAMRKLIVNLKTIQSYQTLFSI